MLHGCSGLSPLGHTRTPDIAHRKGEQARRRSGREEREEHHGHERQVVDDISETREVISTDLSRRKKTKSSRETEPWERKAPRSPHPARQIAAAHSQLTRTCAVWLSRQPDSPLLSSRLLFSCSPQRDNIVGSWATWAEAART